MESWRRGTLQLRCQPTYTSVHLSTLPAVDSALLMTKGVGNEAGSA